MTEIRAGERPPADPGELLSGIRGFITGHRTLEGYGAFADWVRELDRQLCDGANLPPGWKVLPAVLAATMAEQARRWREESVADGTEMHAALALAGCAQDMDALLSIIDTSAAPPCPTALATVAMRLLGMALEGLR